MEIDNSADSNDGEAADKDTSSSSSEELHPIQEAEFGISFQYKDPLLSSGIMKDILLNNKEEFLRKISSGKSVRVVDNNGKSLLHLAVQAARDDTSMIDILLQQEETDINALDFTNVTPLMDSVIQNKRLIAIHLIKAGANVNFPEGCGPIQLCVQHGLSEIGEALIQAGADINTPDCDGDTPLHLAVYYKQMEIMCLLLCYGAESRQNEMFRPFTLSILRRNFKYADILLDFETEFDSMSLDFAIRYEYPNLERLLLKIVEEDKDFCFTPGLHCLSILLNNANAFEFVWKNLQIECDFNSFFQYLFHREYSNESHFIRIMQVLMDSREEFMLKLVKFSEDSPFIYPLVMKLLGKDWNVDLEEICCVFLSYGLVVWDVDLDVVFEKYGFCNLFQLLLHMDIKFSNVPRLKVVPYLYYSVDDTIRLRDLIVKLVHAVIEARCMVAPKDYESLSRLTILPPFKQLRDIVSSSGVSTLTELARNELRYQLCVKNKIKNSSQFYSMLNILPLPNYVKKIISLETPLYERIDSRYCNKNLPRIRTDSFDFEDVVYQYGLRLD